MTPAQIKRSQHKILPKEERPTQGKLYIVSHEEQPVYVAEVTDFKGGCWATLRVREILDDRFTNLYTIGSDYETKVAMYSYEEVVGETS